MAEERKVAYRVPGHITAQHDPVAIRQSFGKQPLAQAILVSGPACPKLN